MLELSDRQLQDFCREHHIRRLSLFGSWLKGPHRPDSDADLRVEFEPEHIPSKFGMARMELELTQLLGKKVELCTPGDLSRYFRQEVLDTAQVQYVSLFYQGKGSSKPQAKVAKHQGNPNERAI